MRKASTKIYIMTDLECAAGVLNSVDYCRPQTPYYDQATRLLTRQVNAAVEGLLSGGAAEIWVFDGHGCYGLAPEYLDERARLFSREDRNWPLQIDGSFDALMYVGQHAMSNTDGAHLAHSGSMEVEEQRINDHPIGEIGEMSLLAGTLGIPLVFLAGDVAACQEATQISPSAVTCPVIEGVRRGSGIELDAEAYRRFNQPSEHLEVEEACLKTADHAEKAVSAIRDCRPWELKPPYQLEHILRRSGDLPRRRAVVESDQLLDVMNRQREYQPLEEA